MNSSINVSMIAKLIIKDWHLFKIYMLGYALIGIISAVILALPSGTAFYTGVILLITVIIGAGAHVAIVSTVTEKKEYQLSFLMGLPIRPIDYALSKVIGGMAIYMVCWLITVGACVVMIVTTDLPNGLLPLVLISALEVLAATTILLCVGVISGAEGITISVMVAFNILFNLFLFWVSSLPGIGPHIESQVAVFNSTAMGLIFAEILVIVLAIGLTSYVKSRRTCFL